MKPFRYADLDPHLAELALNPPPEGPRRDFLAATVNAKCQLADEIFRSSRTQEFVQLVAALRAAPDEVSARKVEAQLIAYFDEVKAKAEVGVRLSERIKTMLTAMSDSTEVALELLDATEGA